MPFKKGTSGNPKGRKPASVTTAKLRDLITTDDVQAILTVIIDQAKQGDIQAAKLILDKVLPSLKSVEVQTDIDTVQAVSIEELDLILAQGLAKIQQQRDELPARLAQLKAMNDGT
jgi:hypothetical protein